jgi:hypothetical protein
MKKWDIDLPKDDEADRIVAEKKAKAEAKLGKSLIKNPK